MKGYLAAGMAIAADGARRLMSRPAGHALGETVSKMIGGSGNRWLVVTVNCPPDRLSADGAGLPEPVARLTSRADVRVQAAPANRGTELGLRLREPPPVGLAGFLVRVRGADPRQEVRSALRDAKSLIETGEVIRPDEPGSTQPTAGGKLLDRVLRLAGGEGRL